MIDRSIFFSLIRTSVFGGRMSQTQVDGVTLLLDTWFGRYSSNGNNQLAYCLATTAHETDRTMQPIREYGRGKGRKYGKASGPYKKIYYGRGYVQLTWEDNYRKMSSIINVDLVKNPDLAMKPEYAAIILYEGMIRGIFTGKKLADYIVGSRADYVGARRIVNSTDQADKIAAIAVAFRDALDSAETRELLSARPASVPEPEVKVDGTPALQSQTVWSQLLNMLTAGGLGSLAFLANMDWKVVVALMIGATVIFGLWAIQQRMKMSKEKGV